MDGSNGNGSGTRAVGKVGVGEEGCSILGCVVYLVTSQYGVDTPRELCRYRSIGDSYNFCQGEKNSAGIRLRGWCRGVMMISLGAVQDLGQ